MSKCLHEFLNVFKKIGPCKTIKSTRKSLYPIIGIQINLQYIFNVGILNTQ